MREFLLNHMMCINTPFMVIVVLVTPQVISGPTQLYSHPLITLECQFHAATLSGATIVVWKRNDILLLNSTLYNIMTSTSPYVENKVVSTLSINTTDYYGTYTCYCYYNGGIVMSNKNITSNQKSITLPSRSSKGKNFTLAGGACLIVCI